MGGWEGRPGRQRRWKLVGWERRGKTARPVLRCHRLRAGVASAPHVGRGARDWLAHASPFPPPPLPPGLTSPAGSAFPPPARAGLGGAGAG